MKEKWAASMRALWWIALNLLGWSLTVAGIILMPLPGPGTLILFLGIVVLSQCYRWARRLRVKVAGTVEATTKASVATKARIFGSITCSFLIIGLGVTLWLDPAIPKSLWFTVGPVDFGPAIPYNSHGVALGFMGSGIIALSLLLYAGIRYRVLKPGPEPS